MSSRIIRLDAFFDLNLSSEPLGATLTQGLGCRWSPASPSVQLPCKLAKRRCRDYPSFQRALCSVAREAWIISQSWWWKTWTNSRTIVELSRRHDSLIRAVHRGMLLHGRCSCYQNSQGRMDPCVHTCCSEKLLGFIEKEGKCFRPRKRRLIALCRARLPVDLHPPEIRKKQRPVRAESASEGRGEMLTGDLSSRGESSRVRKS